jgi:hypothetical protein
MKNQSQAAPRANKNGGSPQVPPSTDRVSPDKSARILSDIILKLGTLADADPQGLEMMAAIISEKHDSFIETEKGNVGPVKRLRDALWNMETDLASLASLFDMIVKDIRCRYQDDEDSRLSKTEFEHLECGMMKLMDHVHEALEGRWSAAWLATGELAGAPR